MHDTDTPYLMIATVMIAYLLGTIPFGLLLTRAAGLGDIRSIGSGNIGATNVLRTGRKGLAAATLLLDATKGALAVLMGWRINLEMGALLCGLAAVIGHLYPVWLNFKGGKGVATGLGVLIAANPWAGAGCCLVWLVVARVYRYSSAAALSAFVAAPFLFAGITRSFALVALALVVGGLVWLRHGANIRRLMAGTEPRIGQK